MSNLRIELSWENPSSNLENHAITISGNHSEIVIDASKHTIENYDGESGVQLQVFKENDENACIDISTPISSTAAVKLLESL